MSTITVNQATEYTVFRDSNRLSQRKIRYSDLVLYVKLETLDSLAMCTAVNNMEYWSLDVNNGDTGNRVDLSIASENDKVFTLNTWLSSDDGTHPSVVQTPLSQEAYNQLKGIGIRGYHYRQHRFDIPYTKNAWLADVFKNHTGEDHPWIRLTLAAEDAEMEMPIVPFPVTAHVFEYDPENSPEEEQLIHDLWNRKWMCIGHA